jgi:uncharacterized protein DUF6644
MSLLPFCQWLEKTSGSIALHESLWMYPLVESVHVLTLCLFVGLAVMLDLRLLGVTMRRTPVSEVVAQLLPWMAAGFGVMVLSGAALFYAIPVKTYLNIFFRIKLVMLALAGLNAWVFHRTVYRRVAEWDVDAAIPSGAKVTAGLSIALWAGIIFAGRMIAYNWFDAPGVH